MNKAIPLTKADEAAWGTTKKGFNIA